MSAFDPNTFMAATLDSANSVYNEPIPTGEYHAVVDNVEVRSIENKKGGESVLLDVTWEITDNDLKIQLDRERLTCRQTIFLDVTPQGTIDMGKGKNVGLGRLRHALGQNVPGAPWSIGNLKGAGPALIRISHRADRNDPEIVYAEVKGVTAA